MGYGNVKSCQYIKLIEETGLNFSHLELIFIHKIQQIGMNAFR